MTAREIKFRFYDKVLKKMKFRHLEKYDVEHPNIEVMQYTGIKDKNGIEIYEGDIFKLGAEKEKFEVRFEHGCFMAFCNGKQYGLIGELQIWFIDVIGNIYQTPELI